MRKFMYWLIHGKTPGRHASNKRASWLVYFDRWWNGGNVSGHRAGAFGIAASFIVAELQRERHRFIASVTP